MPSVCLCTVLGVTPRWAAIARVERGDRGRQRPAHHLHMSFALRIVRALRRRQRRGGVFFGQLVLATPDPDAIHEPLREHGSEPRGQTAASVEIAKERSPFALAHGDAVQFAVQCVSQLARAATGLERIGTSIKDGAELTNEMLPRVLSA